MRSIANRFASGAAARLMPYAAIHVVLLSIGMRAVEAQLIRDSAGVSIVANTTPRWPKGKDWRIGAVPQLDIGSGANGDTLDELARVVGVVRLRNGHFAVANAATANVRIYDNQGRYLRAIGRSGRGPGEFQTVTGLVLIRDDTIVVLHSPGPPVSIASYFSASGSFARQVVVFDMARSVFKAKFFSDGSFVGFATPTHGRRAEHLRRKGRWTDSLPLLHVSGNGARADTLARVPYEDRFPEPSLMPGMISIIFTPRAQLAVSSDGFYVGYPNQYAVGQYTKDGVLRRIIRRTVPPRPVPAGLVKEYRQWVRQRHVTSLKNVPSQARGQLSEMNAAYVKALRFADVLPAYSDLRVDHTAHLWVRRFDAHDAMPECSTNGCLSVPKHESQWDVFDPRGRWLGTLGMPGRFIPFDIGTDYIAGVWRDDDDVEHVRVYPLHRS